MRKIRLFIPLFISIAMICLGNLAMVATPVHAQNNTPTPVVTLTPPPPPENG